MKILDKKKKNATAPQEEGRLNIIVGDHKPMFDYDKNWENKAFRDVVSLLDVKAILHNVPGQPIALSNGYAGYLQILEVYGKDVGTLSDEEQDQAILSFTKWLSGMNFDFAEQTTTLPTDTRKQQQNILKVLTDLRYRLDSGRLSEKERVQLTRRTDILLHNLMILEIVGNEQYNTEFFIWILADTLPELESRVKTALTLTSGFVPHVVSANKKEMILKQYYNSNEPV